MDKWLVKSGNTSDPTTWNDGTLPGATDDCYADGFTGTIDADLTVASVRTEQRTGGTAGGGWVLAGGVTLMADLYAGTTTCVTCVADAPEESMIVGTHYGSTVSQNAYAWVFSGSGNLTVVGTTYGGHPSDRRGVLVSGSGNLTVVGDIISLAVLPTTGTSQVVVVTGPATIDITGSVYAGNGGGCVGIRVESPCKIKITGDVHGGINASYPNSSGLDIANSGGGTEVDVAGNLIAQGAAAIKSVLGFNLRHTGAALASENASAVNSPNVSNIITTGPLENASGMMAMYTPKLFLAGGGPVSWKFTTENLLDRTLYTAETLPGQPAESDVRKGTTYGPSGELTGTLAVPPAAAVGVGVPVDNTVGTAAVTTAAIQAALTSQGLTEARAGYLDKLNVEGDLAKAGDPMALTAEERGAVATAMLDLADGIEANITLRDAIRIIAAAVAGLLSGAGTDAERFKGLDKVTTRLTVRADEKGNRTEITYHK